jgi:sigma-54 specific flagellar transcriptional regulator A
VSEGRFRADLYHRIAILRIQIPPLRERVEDIPFLVDHFLEMFNRKYGRVIHRVTPEALQVLQAYLWPGNIRELRNVLERVYVETRAEVIGARAFRDWIEERQSFAPGSWDLDAGVERRRSQPAVLAPWPAPRGTHSLSSGGRVFDAEWVPADGEFGMNPARRRTQSAELDAEEIRQAYQAADGNLAAAARLLGVHRATLYRYMRRLGLRREDLA